MRPTQLRAVAGTRTVYVIDPTPPAASPASSTGPRPPMAAIHRAVVVLLEVLVGARPAAQLRPAQYSLPVYRAAKKWRLTHMGAINTTVSVTSLHAQPPSGWKKENIFEFHGCAQMGGHMVAFVGVYGREKVAQFRLLANPKR